MAIDLWTEASFNAEEDQREQRFTAARVAVAPMWSFLAAAEGPTDFENRLALVAERIDGVCEKLAEGAEFTALRHAVDTALQRDFRVMDDARKHALREEFLARKRIRQETARREAMRKKADEGKLEGGGRVREGAEIGDKSAEEARASSKDNPVNDERHPSNTPEGGEHAGSKEDCPICSGGRSEARKGPRPFVFRSDLASPRPGGDEWHDGFEDGYGDAKGGGGSAENPDSLLYGRGYEEGQEAGSQQVPTDAAGYGPTTLGARRGPGPTGDADRCPACWGKGWQEVEGMDRAPDCPACKGTGIKKGAAIKVAWTSGDNTNDPVVWQTTTVFTDQPLSGGGEVSTKGFSTLSVRPSGDGGWHWAVVGGGTKPTVAGEAASKDEAKRAAEDAYYGQGGGGQQGMFAAKRPTINHPLGSVDLGLGARYRYHAIHDNGGKYPTLSHSSDSLDKVKSRNKAMGWQHQNSLTIWDKETGQQVHGSRTAGRYCETHDVWIGEGNAANHDEACSIREKATESSRREAGGMPPWLKDKGGGGDKDKAKGSDSGGGDEKPAGDSSSSSMDPPPPEGYDACTECQGARVSPNAPGAWCPTCNGTGITQQQGQDQPAAPQQQPAVPAPAPAPAVPVQAQRHYAVYGEMRKGAPFADYEDFADCTSQNSDKDDPDAYCGEIKHKTEDKTAAGRSLWKQRDTTPDFDEAADAAEERGRAKQPDREKNNPWKAEMDAAEERGRQRRQAQYGTEHEYDEQMYEHDQTGGNSFARTPESHPLDHCPVCGKVITDHGGEGVEAPNGQRWCHEHKPADWNKEKDWDPHAPYYGDREWGYENAFPGREDM